MSGVDSGHSYQWASSQTEEFFNKHKHLTISFIRVVFGSGTLFFGYVRMCSWNLSKSVFTKFGKLSVTGTFSIGAIKLFDRSSGFKRMFSCLKFRLMAAVHRGLGSKDLLPE